MSRFMTFVVTSYTLNLSIILWNTVGVFGISSILADNSNTVPGLFSTWFCSSTNGVISSCSNNILIILGIASLITFGSGLVTLAAFGNTFQAYAVFLSFVPSILTLYNTITAIIDLFGVNNFIASGLGGLFSTIFSITFAVGIIKIQAKVDMES